MDDGLPPNLDSKTFSNDLGKFFVQKIDTIRTQLDIDQQTDSYPEDERRTEAKIQASFCYFFKIIIVYETLLVFFSSQIIFFTPKI